jgi:hypothetical protein
MANVANSAHGSVDTSDIISTSSTTDVLMTEWVNLRCLGLIWSFNSQYSIIPPTEEALVTTADAITDLTLIRADINALEVTSFEAAAYDLGGKTITQAYTLRKGFSAVTSFTLDGQDDPNTLCLLN